MSHQCEDWRYSRSRQPFSIVYTIKVKNFDGHKPMDDIDDTIINGTGNLNNDVNEDRFGWETDFAKDDQCEILAESTNKSIKSNIIYANVNNNTIFSVGALNFTGSLLVNAHIDKMITNVLFKFMDLAK